MFLYVILTFWIFVLLILGIAAGRVNLKRKNVSISNSIICKSLAGFTLTVLWVLTAFRSENIGNDTKAYIDYFRIFSISGIDNDVRLEFGYQLLNIFIGYISKNPHIFLIIISTLFYILVGLYLFRYATNILVSLVLFYCCCFSIFMNILRQGLAMILVMYSFQYLKKGKNMLGFILIVLASFFHKSALVCLLFFMEKYIQITMKKAVFIFLTSIAVVYFKILDILIITIFPTYVHYFDGKYALSGWIAVSYELIRNLVFCFLVLRACERDIYGDRKKDNLVLFNFILLVVLCIFGYSVNLFTRAGEYFLLIGISEFPNILYEKKLPNIKIWLMCICSFMLVMFILILIYRPNWNHLYPYEFWG